MKFLLKPHPKDLALELLGWLLVIVGVAALVLPGPGLLALFAGLALLANRYTWAERRLQPVKAAALKAAHDSVSSWIRVTTSLIGVLVLITFGIIWGVQPNVPDWWPLNDRLWLIGGWGTGITLIGSGVIGGAMILYSYVQFRPKNDLEKEE